MVNVLGEITPSWKGTTTTSETEKKMSFSVSKGKSFFRSLEKGTIFWGWVMMTAT